MGERKPGPQDVRPSAPAPPSPAPWPSPSKGGTKSDDDIKQK